MNCFLGYLESSQGCVGEIPTFLFVYWVDDQEKVET